MRHYPVKITDLVIPNGAAISNALDLRKSRYRGMTIYVPTTLTNACIVQVSPDDSTWFDMKSGGSDIALAADGAIVIDFVGSSYLRIQSAANEGAERTFGAEGVEEF